MTWQLCSRTKACFSLALTDFLSGAFGIPATVFTVLTRRPRSFLTCLGVHLILCALCTVSTFHLLAIALDKCATICWRRCQWTQVAVLRLPTTNAAAAATNPAAAQHQQRQHRSASRLQRAKCLVVVAWLCGALVACLPLMDAFGFASAKRATYREQCYFIEVTIYYYWLTAKT